MVVHLPDRDEQLAAILNDLSEEQRRLVKIILSKYTESALTADNAKAIEQAVGGEVKVEAGKTSQSEVVYKVSMSLARVPCREASRHCPS